MDRLRSAGEPEIDGVPGMTAGITDHSVRTNGAGFHPCLDKGAGFLLRAGRSMAAISRRPRPADQAVATDVMDELFQRAAAIAIAILDLDTDLAKRLAFPRHLARRELPMGVTRHASRVEILFLVAVRATHGRKTKTIRTALDRRLMQPALLALARAIAGRMTVDATRMGEDLAELDEHCRRARGRIIDRGKTLR